MADSRGLLLRAEVKGSCCLGGHALEGAEISHTCCLGRGVRLLLEPPYAISSQSPMGGLLDPVNLDI